MPVRLVTKHTTKAQAEIKYINKSDYLKLSPNRNTVSPKLLYPNRRHFLNIQTLVATLIHDILDTLWELKTKRNTPN
jgi:hypothetical protein